MATDRYGNTIAVGDDVLIGGEILSQPSAGKSVVVVGTTPHTCDDSDLVIATHAQRAHTLSAANVSVFSTTGFDLMLANALLREGQSGPWPAFRDFSLDRVAVAAWSSNLTSATWKMRLDLNGVAAATFDFTVPAGGALFTKTTGTWTTGAGTNISEGDGVELYVDDNSTGSVNDLWVVASLELIER